MKKKVILYATKFMDIYKDIEKCLSDMNFDVIWIEANTIPNNPYNKTLGYYTKDNLKSYMLKASDKWEKLLREEPFLKSIDFFISIIGIDIPPYVFEELDRRNPHIQKVLYLHDRVEGVYQIDEFFQYYNKIFSFDFSDSRQFNIIHLPIYWVPISIDNSSIKYDIFGFASYSQFKPERTKLFKEIKQLAQKNHLNEYIKLYDKSYNQNRIKYAFKVIIKMLLKKYILNIRDIISGLITGNVVSPDKYRDLIGASNVVFDTQAEYQDGLTARFMWALGAGKKIITTNPHVKKYDFYDPKQILIIKDNVRDYSNEILKFIEYPYEPGIINRQKVESYRIDNWINKLLYS